MTSEKSILVLLFALLHSTFLFAQSANLTSDLRHYMAVQHSKKHFSGELLVAKDGNILFHEAVGLASLENNVPVRAGGSYRIASVTKTFTGALIALAVQEKRLGLNDKAGKYVDGLSEKFRDITIHHLLTHTAGLPHNEGIKDYWLVKSKLHLNTQQVIAEINDLGLLYPPGTQWRYSSLGYYLLAVVLEKVYEDEYGDILSDKILKKLQMDQTRTGHALEIIPGMTTGYHLVGDDSLVRAPYRDYSMLKGAGDMHSTAADLLKWLNGVASDDLLNERSKALAFGMQAPDTDRESNAYGYGWFIGTTKPLKYFHGGGTWGYSSYVAFYPEEKVSIIILSNVSMLPVESMAQDIERMVYGRKVELSDSAVPVAADSIDLDAYCGSFESHSGKMKLKVVRHGDVLVMQLAGNPPFRIYPKGNHRFFGKKVDVEIEFTLQDESIRGIVAERQGQLFLFRKI